MKLSELIMTLMTARRLLGDVRVEIETSEGEFEVESVQAHAHMKSVVIRSDPDLNPHLLTIN